MASSFPSGLVGILIPLPWVGSGEGKHTLDPAVLYYAPGRCLHQVPAGGSIGIPQMEQPRGEVMSAWGFTLPRQGLT
jgi:hypothetical protein